MANRQDHEQVVVSGRELSPWEDAFAQYHDMNLLNSSYVFFLQADEPVTEQLVVNGARMLRASYAMLRMRIVDEDGKRYFRPMDEEVIDVKTLSGDWETVHVGELSRKFDLMNGPLWRIRLLEGDVDDRKFSTTMICTFFQGFVDGNTVMRFIDSLLTNMETVGEQACSVVKQEKFPLSDSVETAVQLAPPTTEERHFFQQVALDIERFGYTQNPYIAKFGAVMSRNPDVRKDTRLIPIELRVEQTAKLISLCRKNGTSVNGALTAAAALALCKIVQGGQVTEDLEILVSFAVNMRGHCKPAVKPDHSFANFAPDIEMLLNVPAQGDELEEFWKFAAQCREETLKKIEAGEPQLVLKHFRHMKDTNYSMKRFLKPYMENVADGYREDTLFFMSNLGNLDFLSRERKFQIVSRHCACENALMGPTFCHYVATIHGRLLWSLVYYTNVTTKAQAQEYANEIVAILIRAIDADFQ
ncbi:uncharacterized protein [Ptychodera flava]|uniref:uncharacterized protein n=1 Tax=Ptychodera flava TaxID=63121 RepID=UPI003969F147